MLGSLAILYENEFKSGVTKVPAGVPLDHVFPLQIYHPSYSPIPLPTYISIGDAAGEIAVCWFTNLLLSSK